MGHVTGQQPGAALYLAATWGQCVCVGAWSSWLGGCSRCSQPGRVGFFLTASPRCCNWRPPACFPQPSVCLPHSDHSHHFIELAPEKTFVFPARASVKKLEESLTPPALLLPTPVIFFLPCFCLTASPPLGPLSPNYPSTLTLLLLLLFILLFLLLLSRHRALSSLPVCSSFQALICLPTLYPSLPCHYMLMYTLFKRVTAA